MDTQDNHLDLNENDNEIIKPNTNDNKDINNKNDFNDFNDIDDNKDREEMDIGNDSDESSQSSAGSDQLKIRRGLTISLKESQRLSMNQRNKLTSHSQFS